MKRNIYENNNYVIQVKDKELLYLGKEADISDDLLQIASIFALQFADHLEAPNQFILEWCEKVELFIKDFKKNNIR